MYAMHSIKCLECMVKNAKECHSGKTDKKENICQQPVLSLRPDQGLIFKNIMQIDFSGRDNTSFPLITVTKVVLFPVEVMYR